MTAEKKKPKPGWRLYLPRLLFLIPLLVVVWVPFYNRIPPELGGIPFFYWYQLAWILIAAVIVLVVYLIDTRVTHLTKMAEDWEAPGPPGDLL
ncbi:MAG: DUF3311 domain-containing protein [Methyloceanibacter sp.]